MSVTQFRTRRRIQRTQESQVITASFRGSTSRIRLQKVGIPDLWCIFRSGIRKCQLESTKDRSEHNLTAYYRIGWCKLWKRSLIARYFFVQAIVLGREVEKRLSE